MIGFLGFHLFNLFVDADIIGRSLHITDDTQGNGIAVFVVHHRQLQLQGIILTMGIVDEDIIKRDTVLTNLHHLQAETLLHEAVLVVFTEDEFLTVTHIDGILLAAVFRIYRIVGSVVEDDAMLQNFTYGCTFMLISCLQDLHRLRTVVGNRTGKEPSASTKAQFRRAERVFYGAVRTRLRDEATWRSGTILSFRQTIDAVVQQNHVQVDITAHRMNEVVATNSQTVAVARNLPDSQLRIHHLCACGDCCRTTVNSLHRIGIHIIR